MICAILVAAGAAAYSNSFCDAFVFDDLDQIVDNPAVRSLWPPWVPMRDMGRPVAIWGLAVSQTTSNYRPTATRGGI